MPIPAHLQIAIDQIGKLHDGQDVVRMAQALGAALPAERSYWAQATPNTSWCGVFARWVLWRAGIAVPGPRPDGIGPMWVDWWQDVGTEIPVEDRQPGDIEIYLGNPHHVTFTGDQSDSIGGNQSDGVTRGHYREPDHVRRPPAPNPIMPIGVELEISNGRGSWYSQFSGKFEWVDTGDAPGSAALGCPDDAQGVSFYDHSTLGHWFKVTAPNGVTSIEQQTDIGPNPKTGRTIDISAAAAERFGYSPRNFPTDSLFSWRPIAAPAAVASLTPVQQAVRFRDLRKDQPVTDTTQPSTGTQVGPAIAPLDFNQLYATIQQKSELARVPLEVAVMLFNKLHPDKPLNIPATAPPADTGSALNKPSVKLGTAGLIITTILQALGVVGAPVVDMGGLAATTTGTLGTLLSLGTAAFGAVGGWGSIASIGLKLLSGFMKK